MNDLKDMRTHAYVICKYHIMLYEELEYSPIHNLIQPISSAIKRGKDFYCIHISYLVLMEISTIL